MSYRRRSSKEEPPGAELGQFTSRARSRTGARWPDPDTSHKPFSVTHSVLGVLHRLENSCFNNDFV